MYRLSFSFFFVCFVSNLNVQYLQRTVLAGCDGRSLYSLYPEGKEKKMFGTVNPPFPFSFFLNDKITFNFCDLFIVITSIKSPCHPSNEPASECPPTRLAGSECD